MIYIQKDANNNIIDLDFSYKEGFEKISIFDKEVKQFINDSNNTEIIKLSILKLDLDMVRITEDLIDVMIKKEQLLFTDLPEAVQNKILFKNMLRENLSSTEYLYQEEELRL